MIPVAFIDIEVGRNGKICDIGAIRSDGAEFHSNDISRFEQFVHGCKYLCGHNVVEHDFKYLKPHLKSDYILIDTLYLSPLLFPRNPYHKLVKDDKLDTEELNNPLNDSKKARSLFVDELAAFESLDPNLRKIYCSLLYRDVHFRGFFKYIDITPSIIPPRIRKSLEDRVCSNVNIDSIARSTPVELAYAIAVIMTDDKFSLTPAWVLKNYPRVDNVIHVLRGTTCGDPDCLYCGTSLNPKKALKRWFGYDEFRLFDGEPLQENAAVAAVRGESLLAIFPTGGGKSLTFQLPALIAGDTARALTVVISPLQALMKDQVNNLEKRGIADAVYINGLLSPIERMDTLERVRDGRASILYISPEQLRSATIEKLLMSRTIARFVIDEAHCFSAWGQDFRIEYMYIGDFIQSLQKQKGLDNPIPVSCFTATAKPKVVSDIYDYFYNKLGLRLRRFMSSSQRTNLHYSVLYRDTKRDKYETLRSLLDVYTCPTIVYVSRTKLSENLAEALRKDGFDALAYHGQMQTNQKVENQEAFMSNAVQIMVATSAFGMGVDKDDVGLVVHYDISDSLENYIQEAGRAGRDVNSKAECYVLYNDDDLNKHFILLNQTKLTLGEINQVWRALRGLSENRSLLHVSALEVARRSGWDESHDVETKVKSALAALEDAGFIRRGKNCPRIFATSIIPDTYESAAACIDVAQDFSEEDRINAKRIVKSLISEKRRAIAGTMDAESRIDYLSDMLGIELKDVIRSVEKMRGAGVLAKDTEMVAYLKPTSQTNNVRRFYKLETFLLKHFITHPGLQDLKEVNGLIEEQEIVRCSIKDIRTILMFWVIKGYMAKSQSYGTDRYNVHFEASQEELENRIQKRGDLIGFILRRMLELSGDKNVVLFSIEKDILDVYNDNSLLDKATLSEVQETLLYLSKIDAFTLEGGFMVLYNQMEIERLNMDNRSRYKKEDYQKLDEFYKQKIQQIHIVGEYANMMVRDYDRALAYVRDYFQMEYKEFVKQYFDSSRQKELTRNISPKKYDSIYGCLTEEQRRVIDDKDSRFIMVPAGPGSGKTFLLVRKLASLILMEDIKSEQLLMLTFSRAAASEFKSRLFDLIGNAAKYVEVKTFHSFCFDILGIKGSVERSENVVKEAVEQIRLHTVERSKITKSILVIDEAQDMDEHEFALVQELIAANEDMRVIAVGDDDQNIYQFRGSDSKYMGMIGQMPGAAKYELLENFRSDKSIVSFANTFAKTLIGRLKSMPIVAKSEDKGNVYLTYHTGLNLEQAILDDVMLSKNSGTTCVLTNTNEDAAVVVAMLASAGINAHLIQSESSFSLKCLAEIRELLSMVSQRCTGSYLVTETWDLIRQELCAKYKTSSDLKIVMNLMDEFEKEYKSPNGQTVGFVSDLEEFVNESSLEDFDPILENPVVVSTIHKSKGRQFDNVIILYKNEKYDFDRDSRPLYVAITRAKHNLMFHFNCDTLPSCITRTATIDGTEYHEISQAIMQLSHKDVVLDYFKSGSSTAVQAGAELTIDGNRLRDPYTGRTIAYLSAAARQKLDQFYDKGFIVSSSVVRHNVWWAYEENECWKQCQIVLPNIYLRKKPE